MRCGWVDVAVADTELYPDAMDLPSSRSEGRRARVQPERGVCGGCGGGGGKGLSPIEESETGDGGLHLVLNVER